MKILFKIFIIICCVTKMFSQQIFDTSYCSFDTISRIYTFKKFVSFSSMQNPSSSAYRLSSQGAVLKEDNEFTDVTALKHHRFIQTVNSIPIYNSQVAIRERNDTVYGAAGLLNTNVPNLKSVFDTVTIIQQLLGQLNYYKYAWQDTNSVFKYPSPKIYYYKLNDSIFNQQSNFKLVYITQIEAIVNPTDSFYSNYTFIIDAQLGSIIKQYDPTVTWFQKSVKYNYPVIEGKASRNNTTDENKLVKASICASDCNATTPNIFYYGTGQIFTEKFLQGFVNCTHRLKDNCTGTYLYVDKIGTAFSGYYDFTSNSNLWNESGNPSSKVGATALWSIRQAHDFYRIWLNRNSYDNNYSQIMAHVSSNSNEQTHWQLSSKQFTIGLFNGSLSFEVTLDIIGHELSHGVSDNICKLGQDGILVTPIVNSEEGALAEGYSDIFGQGVEHYVDYLSLPITGAYDDYYQGSNFPQVPNMQRNLANPKSTNNPDTYHGINWITASQWTAANGGPDFVHTNSTIMSHWYYLLSEGTLGSTLTNDIGNKFCITGIGQGKALQIAYLSLYYLVGTPKQFIDARNATIAATKQLYGNFSYELSQVIEAWYGVGVGNNYSGYPINYINITVSNGQTFMQKFNNELSITNFKANSGSNVTLTSNTQIDVLESEFAAGSESSLYIGPGDCGQNGARMANNNHKKYFTNSDVELLATTQTINKNEKIFNAIVYPNPSNTGLFNIDIQDNSNNLLRCIVRDVQGREVGNYNTNGQKSFTINLSDKSNGMYFINFIFENSSESIKLLKEGDD